MNFQSPRGIYSPSYYRIKLGAYIDLEPLDKLHVEVQSVFFHEYFHFLQDVTSEFGYNCSWNTYDRIVNRVSFYQKTPGDIEIPPPGIEAFEDANFNLNIFLAQCGDNGFRSSAGETPAEPLIIESYRVTPKHDKVQLDASCGVKFIQLTLRDNNGNPVTYWFGGIAIVETMTHLIQQRFFGENEHPDLPYKAAIFFSKILSEKIGNNEEFIFALCDLAICTPYPGQTFLELILEIDKWEADKISTEEIYNFGLQYISGKWRGLKSKNGLLHQMGQVFGHEIFNNEREWLTHVIEAGDNLRKTDPLFMLKLYRNATPFGGKFYEVYTLLGVPEVINSLGKRWFAAPSALRERQDQIHTVFLSAFKQLHDLFLSGIRKCCLIDHCANSEPKMPVDDKCLNAPWLKAKEKAICPFGAVWVALGLQGRNVIFKE